MSEKVPALIRGVHYESMAEAARQIGCTFNAVQHAINCGKPDSAGLGRNWNRKKQIRIDGVLYESIADGASAIGVTRRTLSGRLSRGCTNINGHTVELIRK